MIHFYKKRDFSSFISDTFLFFKEYGKNYFKNYTIINGLIIILLLALIVFGFGEIFSQMFTMDSADQTRYFERYFEENNVILILVSILILILYLVLMLFSYLFPVLYMKRVSETGAKSITMDQILADIKSQVSRFILFALGMMFIITPLIGIVLGVSVMLIFIIIGIPLLFILLPAIINVIQFLLYDYFHTKKGFFASLSYAIRAQFSYQNGADKSPFWKYWAATTVMYMVIQVIISVFTMIPMFMMMGSAIAGAQSGKIQANPFEGTMGWMVFAIYAISILASIILSNFLYVNSGFMYYDSRIDLHRSVSLSEIDRIGTRDA